MAAKKPEPLFTPRTCKEPDTPEYKAMQGDKKHLRGCPNSGGGWVHKKTCLKCPDVWHKYWKYVLKKQGKSEA